MDVRHYKNYGKPVDATDKFEVGALLISGYLLPDNDDEEGTKNNSKIK